MQVCFLCFFFQFFNRKKVSVIVSQHLVNPEWEVGRRKCWGRAHRPEADNPADTQVSQPQNLQSTSSRLLPSSQTASPPLPTCSNTPTGKAPFQQPTRPTHCFYQGCRPPPRQDHQDPTRASPSLTRVQRSTPRTHLLACLSSFRKIFWGGPARCPTNCKHKIILSPLQELFLTFPSLLKSSITIYFPGSHSKYYF